VLDRPISGRVSQRLSHNPIRAAEAFTAVHEPIITDTGTRIAGLRLGDRRAHALLQAVLVFRLLPNGFANHALHRRGWSISAIARHLRHDPDITGRLERRGSCRGRGPTDPSPPSS
jgi:hypothetical protein